MLPRSRAAVHFFTSVPSSRRYGFGLLLGALLISVSAAAKVPTVSTQATTSSTAGLVVRHHALPEALVPFGNVSAKDDAQLQVALAAYEQLGSPERVAPLVDFLSRHTSSPWRQSLWLNLGSIYYRHGYFSDSLHAWREAWNGAKTATSTEQRAIADQAVGELIRMHARLGHADGVQALLEELSDRPLTGSATEAVQGAREGLWRMRNEPGVAYLCGPMALRSLVTMEPSQHNALTLLEAARSGPTGFSLAQVSNLSQQAELPYRAVFREQGSEIPVPSVVHWNVSHYAAIVGFANGRYQIKDPTFGEDLWLSAAAINAQTSGYFLVTADKVGSGWRAVNPTEAQTVRGMGYTTSMDPNATRPYDDSDCCQAKGGGKGMPTFGIHSMLVSLNIRDTPVGYTPPKGPAVDFTLSYSQREANQPALLPFGNFSPKWMYHWLSYVTDDPTQAGISVSLAVPGGGTEKYAGYSSSTGAFTPEATLGATLVRTASAPITYERRFSDGAVHVYQHSDGSTTYPRRILLTTIRNPDGNALSLAYDAQHRLITLTDALAKVTTLTYADPANSLHITKITDPFGRFASFGYDANGRLSQITDAAGMSSSFGYDAGSFVNSLTTPYGTTGFAYGEDGTTRWLQVTDPLGKVERVETRHQAPGIASSEAVVPTGINTFNSYLDGRNTFYWDKDAWAKAPGDYTQARLKHWLHDLSNIYMTAPVLESTKVPGENRVWFNYPGQVYAHSTGTFHRPSAVARVLDDGSTQLTRTEYNTLGRITKTIDAVGREERYEYTSNAIDLMRITRKNGSAYEQLAGFSYNSQHLPVTGKDDAGQTLQWSYNSAGQLLTATDPLLQVTSYEYDNAGYLRRIKNPNGLIQQSFTYDDVGRLRTVTDSEGYVLTYDYDALDRPTRTTYPDTTYESIVYDKLDRHQVRDRLGRTTTYTHNAVRQLTQIDEPLPRTIRMEWSPSGRKTALFDGENRPIRWEYDIVGRQTAEVYADDSRKTYGYDLAGRLKSVIDGLNQTKSLSYTLDDRLAGISYSNAVNATPSVSFAYDPVHPRMTSMTDGLGSTTFAYGALGAPGAQQLIRDDGPYARHDVLAVTAFDALGRRLARRIGGTYTTEGSLEGGQAETVTYDELGRLATKASALGDFSYRYLGQTDQLSQRTVAASGRLNTPALSLSYDDNAHDRRLTRLRYASAPAALPTQLLQDYAYAYDTQGRLTKIEETSYGSDGVISAYQAWDTTHDDADRLQTYAPTAEADPETSWHEYAYDQADNRNAASLNGSEQSIAINNLNQAIQVNAQAYSYDANGNLLSDGTNTYQWDAENRLISFTQGTTTTTFRYDGLGRRLETNVGTKKYRHVWCGAEICQTRTGSNFAIVQGTFFDEGVQTPTASYLAFRDQLGSVRQLRSRSSASSIGTLEYGPYGEKLTASGAQTTNSGPRFAGMYYDNDVGLYFTQYRVYSPTLGRWLSRDPIGVAGGINLYAYVGGNPLMLKDPRGLASCSNSNCPYIGRYQPCCNGWNEASTWFGNWARYRVCKLGIDRSCGLPGANQAVCCTADFHACNGGGNPNEKPSAGDPTNARYIECKMKYLACMAGGKK